MVLSSSSQRFALSLGALAFVAGCGGMPEDAREESVAEIDQAIAGGYVDEADAAVVGVLALNLDNICTGTLLAPNLVLTARHCVSAFESADGTVPCDTTTFDPPSTPGDYFVTTLPVMSNVPDDYHVAAEVVLLPDGDAFCGRDLALLVLKDNISASEAKPLAPRIDLPLEKDERYSAIGYGAIDDAGNEPGVRRRRDDLVVTCVGDACSTVNVTQTEWMGNAGVCLGDSGGPAIDAQNRVVGVTSRGSPDCTSPIYGAVKGWDAWLAETAIKAAAKGGYAAPAWAAHDDPDPLILPESRACSIQVDPTKPVPWRGALLALGLFTLMLRRRSR